MKIYVLFLGLLSQSFASHAAEALPPRKLTMSEEASRYFALTPLEQKFERFLGSAPYSSRKQDMSESDFAENPVLAYKYALVKEAIRAGNVPKQVLTYINKREGEQLLLESPADYLHRLVVSHRARAQSEPMPEIDSLASERSLSRPASLPAEVFSHARASLLVDATPGAASTAHSGQLK